MNNGADRLARKRQQAESAEIRKASGVFRTTPGGYAEPQAVESARTPLGEAMCDSCAEAYDEFLASVSVYFAEDAIRRVRLLAGAQVLDVASGTGAFSSRAALRGARVLSVDGTLPKASLEDGKFDVVASLFGPMLLSGHDHGLRELGRVLKPGGRLVLSLVTSDLLRFGAPSPQAVAPNDEQHVKDRLSKLGFRQVQALAVRQVFTFARAESLGELLPIVTPAWARLLRRLSAAEREHTLKVLASDLRKRQGQGPFAITCEALLTVAHKPAG